MQFFQQVMTYNPALDYLVQNYATQIPCSVECPETFAVPRSPSMMDKNKDIVLVVLTNNNQANFVGRVHIQDGEPRILGLYYGKFDIRPQEQKYTVPVDLAYEVIKKLQDPETEVVGIERKLREF